jgi:CRISPR/Cas system-associated exonuclease Cas4 (RecB family)
MNRDHIIRASEIAQYAYCARAWWFHRVKGWASANVSQMEAGEIAHRAHGRTVMSYHHLRALGYMLLAAAVILIALVWWIGQGP